MPEFEGFEKTFRVGPLPSSRDSELDLGAGMRLNFPIAFTAHSALMVRGLRLELILGCFTVKASVLPISHEVPQMKLSISLTQPNK